MRHHVKRRPPATPGSIPAVLEMFESEVRFYREIAPVVGVRVPACYQAEHTAEGTGSAIEPLAYEWPSDEGTKLAATAEALTGGTLASVHSSYCLDTATIQ